MKAGSIAFRKSVVRSLFLIFEFTTVDTLINKAPKMPPNIPIIIANGNNTKSVEKLLCASAATIAFRFPNLRVEDWNSLNPSARSSLMIPLNEALSVAKVNVAIPAEKNVFQSKAKSKNVVSTPTS